LSSGNPPRASASDRPPGAVMGQLSEKPPAEVLRELERKRASARVHFDTEIGRGEVDLIEGKIVDALLGDLFGRQALLSLIGMTEGQYSVSELAGEARPAMCEGVGQLVADRDRRIAEWRGLAERMPPLTASLRLKPESQSALSKADLSSAERQLMRVLDGRRTIADMIDASGLDAVDAFRILLAWREASHLLELPAPEVAAEVPFRPAVPRSEVHPGGSGEPLARSVTPRQRRSPHRTTVIGMGIPKPQSAAASRTTVHRVISVGPEASAPIRTEAIGHQTSLGPEPEVVTERPRRGSRRLVGRYEIIGRIGHGGMGSVYLCRLTSETGFRRLFALKLLREHLLDDVVSAGRFLEEARLAGLLHHPNVVSVVDAGIDEAQPYLVMDYVEGASLKQLVTAHPLAKPAELVVPLFLDALAGLQAVHTLAGEDGVPLNVVHCDVSPDNLLVGVDGICRLTDFGVARRESNVGERLMHGKPAYLAPEQVLRQPIDRRTDLFALGIVLYNTLTGVKLFDGRNVGETLARVTNEAIQPPSAVGLGPPPCFDFILMKALDRDPSRRYETAEEMAEDLRRVALRERLLAPTNEVAAWVRASVGRELDQRRLLVLDSSRGTAPERAGLSVPPGQRRPESFVPLSAVPRAPMPLAESAAAMASDHTVALDLGGRARRWALLGAAALAAGAVLVTLLWPTKVSRLFNINTAGVRSYGVDIGLDRTGPSLPGSPSAAPGDSGSALEKGPPGAPTSLSRETGDPTTAPLEKH